MEIRVESEKGIIDLHLHGNLNLESADELMETVTNLLEQGNKFIALDFSGVYLMDSHGLGELVRILRRIVGANGVLVLHNMPANIKRVIELARLHLVIEIFSCQEEAEQRLQSIMHMRKSAS